MDKFRTAFFGQFCTNLRKDSVANYAWICTLSSPSVRGLDVLGNALNISLFRCHEIHEIAVFQNFPKRKQPDADVVVTIEIVINSAVRRLTLYPAGVYCLAWDDAFGF